MNAINRRELLLHALAGAIAVQLPGVSFAATTGDARLVVILLRGALDGLAFVPPLGDPDYARLHGDIAIAAGEALPLDGFFGLHPSLAFCADRWQAGELVACHAVATP